MNVNGFNLQVGVYANTDPATIQIKKFLTDAKKTSDLKLDIKFNSQGRQAINQVKTATGDLVTITKQYNKQGQLVDITVNKLSRDYKNLTSSTQQQIQAQQNLNNTAKHSVGIFEDFTRTFAKMAKYNTINLIYDGMITKMSEAIQITNDFDKAMTEFKKVTDTSNLSLSEYSNTLGELGEATARTTTQMLEAATAFSKSGYTAEESAKLAQIATLYQNIADAEISAGDAASFIVSQMKAYDIKVEEATSIIDKINEVSNNFSVSSTDIASALTKQSASLATYGNNLNESIALVTAGTEIMTGQAGKVARGLRTIGANITQLAQEAQTFEIQVNGVTKSVNLWNEAGTDMLDTYKVLQQISKYWKDMTNAERSSLAITLAKKTQMDTFLATMSNFEDAEKAYTTALLAEGSAWKENEAYMESIEAHQSKMKAQWEQLMLSAPIEDLEKALLDAGTALLEFANSKVGQAIIKLTTLVTVMALLNKAFSALQTLLISKNATSVFLSGIISLITGETTLLQTTVALTTAMAANPLFWGVAAVASIYAIYKAIDYLSSAFERNLKQISELNEAYKTAKQEVDNLEDKLKELNKTIKDTEARKLEIVDEDELRKLNQATEELSRQEAVLKYQLQLAKSKADEAEREARAKAQTFKTTEQKATTYTYSDQGGLQGTGGVTPTVVKGTPQEVFEKELDGLESIQQQIEKNKKSIEELSVDYETNKYEIEALEKSNSDLVDIYNQVEKETNNTASGLLSLVELGLDADKSIQGLLDRFGNVSTEAKKVVDGSDEITDSEEEAEEATDALSEELDKVITPLSNIESNYSLLAKAVKEFNEKGGMSASTIKKLSELDADWTNLLKLENGQLVIKEEELGNVVKAERDNAIAILQAQAAQDMKNAAYGNYNELSPIAQKAIQDVTNDTKEEASASLNAAKNITLETAAIEARNKVKYGNGTSYEEYKQALDAVNAIESAYADMIDRINQWSLDTSESSSKSASSSKDAWVEAFKEEQRQLKHALEMNEITEIQYYEKLKDLNEKYFGEISGKHKQYLKEYQENEEEIYKGLKEVYDKVSDYLKEAIEQGYEDAINAIKKEEKRIIDEIKAQLEALKDEKKKVLDDIQNQIDGLKKKKEKVQDYWNSQIDKIKESNDALQKQNELLEKQQALQRAKAQKVMVMKNGKFQLGENEAAVSQAEQALSEYQDQLSYEQQISEMEKLRDAQVKTIDDRIEKLEEHKKYMEKYYDEQIDALEKHRDEVEKQYEKQIEDLQDQLDAFKKGAEQQKKIEEARLTAQVIGINNEADLFKISLANLKSYVETYNKLLSMQDEVGSKTRKGELPSGEGSFIKATTEGIASGIEGVSTQVRASGDASFRGDEIALVGESPNTELLIGSHLNHSVNSGTLVHMTKGSGVVNAESTSTLAGLLNGIVKPNNVANNRTVTQSFTFGNLTLPNVTDADSFVNTLSHKFNNYAIQYGNSRK